MQDFTITELFFIITGTAVVIITILLAACILYIIMFLRNIQRLAKTAKDTAIAVSGDISELRKNIKEKGVSVSSLASFAKTLAKRKIFGNKKIK